MSFSRRRLVTKPLTNRVSHSGGVWGAPSPPSYDYFNPPSKPMAPPAMGHPHVKMKPPPPPPPLSEKQSTLTRWTPLPGNDCQKKNPEKLETIINTCASIIKQHWKKVAEILQERDFFTCSIQNLVRKVKQFVRNIIFE